MQLPELLARYRESSLVGSASSLLHWDLETMMPSGAAEGRGEMLAVLAQLSHRMMTDLKFIEGVKSLDPAKMSAEERRQAGLLRLQVLKQNAFDEAFVARSTQLEVKTHETWKKARAAKDFSLVSGALKEMVDLKREEAQRLSEHPELKSHYRGRSRYETLMDSFEPDFSADRLRALLGDLRQKTLDLLPKVLAKVESWPAAVDGTFRMPVDKQTALGRDVSGAIGLDFQRARLDTSVHPFCTSFNGEVRITTRHDPEDFSESLLGVIHESGHGLYEMNIPRSWKNSPMGSAVSLGVHESQSRFMENMIARSRPFSVYLAGKTGHKAEDLFRHLNRVQRSYIRTESDEVTYNLHILLRMSIEEDLIEGRLEPKDLPARWNSDFEGLLGLRVPDDSLGCMQDTHWYGGAFGYFPTYSLGNLLAAELFALFRKAVPDWESQVEQGRFEAVAAFLKETIHDHAARWNSTELTRKILGRDLGTEAFAAYVKEKFSV